VGADRSPLDYVGYHVGKTSGLPVREREQRLHVCFRIDISRDLIADYRKASQIEPCSAAG
jgi:hypothetical protein